uniref:Uncharacterized protein n=1 Tax=Parascaris equorum TaxID=6256 RepID=A0A914RSR7_PAREQ
MGQVYFLLLALLCEVSFNAFFSFFEILNNVNRFVQSNRAEHEISEDFEGGIITVVGLQLSRPIRTSGGHAEFKELPSPEATVTTSEFTETLPPDIESSSRPMEETRRFSRKFSYDVSSRATSRKRSLRP